MRNKNRVPEGQRPLFSDHRGEKLIVDDSGSKVSHLLSPEEIRARLAKSLGSEVDPRVIALAAKFHMMGDILNDPDSKKAARLRAVIKSDSTD